MLGASKVDCVSPFPACLPSLPFNAFLFSPLAYSIYSLKLLNNIKLKCFKLEYN